MAQKSSSLSPAPPRHVLAGGTPEGHDALIVLRELEKGAPPMEEAKTKDTPAGDIPAPPSLEEPEPIGGPDLTDVKLEELEGVTAEEVEAHRTTHLPYRSWCADCVMGRGGGVRQFFCMESVES